MLSTSDTCIVRGDLKLAADGRLRFEKLANNGNEIGSGEQVVTAHVSDRFVQGTFSSDISVNWNWIQINLLIPVTFTGS